ncbi:hypothetical protein FHG87_021801 [Trinorchestia longiramus]|nr:hypothetical protein FHG87_021801 [Trinorchestia longiramus]
MESELWSRSCGVGVVESESWSRSRGVGVVESELWSRSRGVGVLQAQTRLANVDQSETKTTKVDPATRLGFRYDRSTTLTKERSRSGCSAQPTALYNEATTLCDGLSIKRFQSDYFTRILIT